MPIKSENRSTWVFIGFLLLGGICNTQTRTRFFAVDTIMFSANFMIYIGLLIFWMQSVRSRLLPTRARGYIVTSVPLMIFYLLVRVLRFRILTEVVIRRYVDYAYNIPLLLIPALFLMTCIRIHRGEQSSRNGRERLLLIPACIMLCLIMTNDLHQLFYRRLIPLSEFHGIVGTYTHGPLFYLMYGWIVAASLTGVSILVRKMWRENLRGLISFVAVVLIWGGLDLLNLWVFDRYDLVQMYYSQEINVFGMLGFFEVCIRNRMIPYNENYSGFFSHLELPALITDRNLNPVWESAVSLRASQEQLASALARPAELGGDAVLHGRAISGGAAFWVQDEGTIRRLNEELEDANDTLALENELLERERDQQAEMALVRERNDLYAKAALAVYPAQKRIDALLSQAEPDTPAFRPLIAEVAALTAYVKRKSNFVMVAAQRDAVSAEELAAAIRETAHYFRYCGLQVTLSSRTARDFSCREAMDLYDTVEAVLEVLCAGSADCLVRLEDACLTCMVDGETPPELPETPCPVSARAEDGQILLTVRLGGEAS